MIDLSSALRKIAFKIVLAGLSGACVAWIFFTQEHWLPASNEMFVLCAVGGLLFSIGVLFPCLNRTKSYWHRGLGLVAVASLSFYSALLVADNDMADPFYIRASLVGAFIVLVGARFSIPLKSFFRLLIAGLPAAIIGGIVFMQFPLDSYFPFIIWHILMAVTIHVAENWKWLTSNVE